ncbi:MAG: ATP-binding protein [Mycobacterium sp.]|nr:ATP-binding protein [Mycobacterium sp.]
MITPEHHVLSTSASPEALEEFDGLLAKTWSSSGHVPEMTRIQVGIAVGEIGANIIRYSGSATIRMEVKALPNEVWVEFEDNGIPAQVDLDSVTLPEDMAEAGRGLALARAALAKLSYRRDTVNHWTLVSKRFG